MKNSIVVGSFIFRDGFAYPIFASARNLKEVPNLVVEVMALTDALKLMNMRRYKFLCLERAPN